jgi:transposase
MKYTIKDFQAEFKTDADCLDFIFKLRAPAGGTCKCGKSDCFYPVKGRKSYACSWCGRQISPTEGTIFHKSPTPLKLWFHAIFLMSTSKNGVAAMEIMRQTGVTYKTAWRMAHQIRKLMDNPAGPMAGIVEADETWVGGTVRGKGQHYLKNKSNIIGLAQRNGPIKAVVAPDTKAKTLIPNITANVKEGSTICTDELSSYRSIARSGYLHARVNHKQMEWVRAFVHTNSLEGFWSQLKRSINGTFHHVSKKHLQAYLNEFVYRYNLRKSDVPLFSHLSKRMSLRLA